jgi:hypothetical protein
MKMKGMQKSKVFPIVSIPAVSKGRIDRGVANAIGAGGLVPVRAVP